MQLPSIEQVDGQLVDAPLHRYGVHDGEPGAPPPEVVQVPGCALQVWQAPVHALAQQMLLTQKPDEHWRVLVHDEALPSVGVQVPELQK